jgi:exosortase
VDYSYMSEHLSRAHAPARARPQDAFSGSVSNMSTQTSIPPADDRVIMRAHLIYGLFLIASVGLFWKFLASLVEYSLHNESSSHVILIPFVSAYLLYMQRKRIFSSVRPSIAIGVGVILFGVALFSIVFWNIVSLEGNDPLSLATLAFVFVCAGGFLVSYGIASARAACFPLLFLLLMVPLPDAALAWTIHALQQGSTDLTCFLFKLIGVPFLRQGFVIALPGVTIEVAAECSGIRSSVALLITCLLVAHLYLRTPWKIALFLLLVLPLTVVKNAVRIVTLTMLSLHVDPSFLHGRLHHQGGIVFFLLGLLILLPVFLALEKSERKPRIAKA